MAILNEAQPPCQWLAPTVMWSYSSHWYYLLLYSLEHLHVVTSWIQRLGPGTILIYQKGRTKTNQKKSNSLRVLVSGHLIMLCNCHNLPLAVCRPPVYLLYSRHNHSYFSFLFLFVTVEVTVPPYWYVLYLCTYQGWLHIRRAKGSMLWKVLSTSTLARKHLRNFKYHL